MLVKNEIMWYKLSIRRIEFSALSDDNGGEKREIAGGFREWREGGEKFYLNRA
jgi:hypothetical protein